MRSRISSFDLVAVVLSPLYQLYDLALQSPKNTVRYGPLLKINSRFNSRFLINVSNYFMVWLGYLCKKTSLHNLPLIMISNSGSIEVHNICICKEDLK